MSELLALAANVIRHVAICTVQKPRGKPYGVEIFLLDPAYPSKAARCVYVAGSALVLTGH